MCGRLSARTCHRLAIVYVAVGGAGRASEFERDVLDTRFENVRVGAERRGSFIAAPSWCSMRAAIVADLAQEAGLYFTLFTGRPPLTRVMSRRWSACFALMSVG
jgi:hypothetical protein